jgi:hypothetical protein
MHSYFEKKAIIDRVIGGTQEKPNTELVSVWKIDDLSQWAWENWYNYKDVKILNRWIIGESLPDGVWEIMVLTD